MSCGEGETWIELCGGGWPVEDELDRFEAICRAVVAGRVVDRYRRGRRAVEVALADGSTDGSTGFDLPLGLLPEHRWRERAAVKHFAPYL